MAEEKFSPWTIRESPVNPSVPPVLGPLPDWLMDPSQCGGKWGTCCGDGTLVSSPPLLGNADASGVTLRMNLAPSVWYLGVYIYKTLSWNLV